MPIPTATLHAATKQYVEWNWRWLTPTAEYITSSANAALSAERVLTNTASVTWDFATAGQAKANIIGAAPTGAEYITSIADATLTAERVLTDTASITWDRTTAGQIKANTTAGGGNVSNSGTPTSGQYGKWVTATTIQGVAPATVLSDIGAAPLASPTFTGDPQAPTPAAGDNDTSIATTAFVKAAVRLLTKFSIAI